MEKWVRPPLLKLGDTIGIVSPSGPPDATELAHGCERLKRWGFEPVVAPHVVNTWGQFAGSDAERAADFNSFWADPRIRGILCSRGGEGAMRLLQRIDWDVVRAMPKFFCGFSDITALHLAIAREARMVTFHGPMAAAFGPEVAADYNERALYRAMTSSAPLGTIEWPTGDGAPLPVCIVPGIARGTLMGGCLSLVASLVGTPWAPQLEGALLVVEDVNETPARCDRMITQLLLSGVLSGVKGVIFGHSPDCETPPEGKRSLHLFELLADLLGPLGVPVLYGFPCGHGPHRTTLPFGVLAELDAGAGHLTVLDSALQDRRL